MQITPVAKKMGELFQSDFFVIPRFQRPYSWTGEQLEDFWTDVVAERPSEYFLGAVVVYSASGRQNIVDGQQRMTTATMLLCAVRDFLHEEGAVDLAKGVQLYVERPDRDNVPRYVLRPVTSEPFFQNGFQSYDPGLGAVVARQPRTDEERNLSGAYEYLAGRLRAPVKSIKDSQVGPKRTRQAVEKYLKEVRDAVVDLQVIYLSLDSEDSAYTVFETLNTRGLDLRLVDKVRTYVMNCARPRNPQSDRAKTQWEDEVLDVLEKSEARIDPDAFLVHNWLSRYDYVTKKEVYKKLKRRFNSKNIFDLLDELAADAKLYRTIREPECAGALGSWTAARRPLQFTLTALNLFDVKQPTPMILSALRGYKQGRLKWGDTLRLSRVIEDFHFYVHAISSKTSSGGITQMYSNHARRVAAAGDKATAAASIRELAAKLLDRKPTRAEFDVAFAAVLYAEDDTAARRLVKYILYRLSQHTGPALPLSFEDSTIEHLAARNPSNRSLSVSAVNSLGNLLLVDGRFNSDQLQNKPPVEKLKLLKAAGVPLDQLLQHALMSGVWDEAAIQARTEWLAATAYEEVWKVAF